MIDSVTTDPENDCRKRRPYQQQTSITHPPHPPHPPPTHLSSLLAVPLPSTPSPASDSTTFDDSGLSVFGACSVLLSCGGGSTITEMEKKNWLRLFKTHQFGWAEADVNPSKHTTRRILSVYSGSFGTG